ncbi:MAG: hypothetical protein N2971_07180 [Chlorobi bacterium]|nr:hypothetical protein [Chlorobiota bacterium]
MVLCMIVVGLLGGCVVGWGQVGFRVQGAHPFRQGGGSPDRVSYVRPFITDDARVVGGRLSQIETWIQYSGGGVEHWILGAYGVTEALELTLGATLGVERSPVNGHVQFGSSFPLLQAKYLFRPYADGEPPGIAAVAGVALPGGSGFLKPTETNVFSYVCVSQCIGAREDVLIHGNVGGSYLITPTERRFTPTWGLGTQIRTLGGFHLVGEVISGDPYQPGSGLAYQVGFRHFFSDYLQIDGTYGKGISGAVILEPWSSFGVRIVW